jgi:hypothetical protein
VAIIDAPTSGSPVLLVTIPLMLEVVIWADKKLFAINTIASENKILLSISISLLVQRKGIPPG